MSRFDRGQISVSPGCRIPVAEVKWRFDTSGGPGGQYANRAHSRVEASLDLTSVTGVDKDVRQLLETRLGPTLSVVVSSSRSQYRNRRRALEELESRLREALQRKAKRQRTQASRGAIERRLADKRRRGKQKADRGWRWDRE